MFLKKMRVPKNGKRHTYWALVKSVRTARGPRHEVVSYLGELRSSERAGWGKMARAIDRRAAKTLPLFDRDPAPDPVPETVEVQLRRVRVERTQDFGEVFLGLALWRALELDPLLEKLLPPCPSELLVRLVAQRVTVPLIPTSEPPFCGHDVLQALIS